MQGWSEVSQQDLAEALKLMSLAQKHDKAHQTMLYETLNSHQKDPKMYVCLLRILLGPEVDTSLREVAGLTLKSLLKRNYHELPNELLSFLKAALLQHFLGSEPRISKILALLINVFVSEKGADLQILEFLLAASRTANESALKCLAIVLEDLRSASQNAPVFGSAQFDHILQQIANSMLELAQSPSKALAMQCLNCLIPHLPSNLTSLLQQYLALIEAELPSASDDICYRAMEGLQIMSEQRKELIRQSTVRLVAQRQFRQLRTRKLQLLFWSEVVNSSESEDVADCIPLLLPKCILALEFAAEDLANQMKSGQLNEKYMEEADSHEDTQEDLLGDEDSEKVESGYTLRKMAGILVSKLAVNFCEGLWELSRPLVEELLQQLNWLRCEVGILFIGLIAEFCSDQLAQSLPSILHVISETMSKHSQPQLVATCLWTMAQFSHSIIGMSQSNVALLESYVASLLRYLESTHGNVKQAACSSLAEIVAAGREKISGAFPHILGKLVEVLRTENGDSMASIMTSVSVLASNLPEQLKTEEVAQATLKVLCEKWVRLSEGPAVEQVIECLVDVSGSFSKFIRPHSVELFQMAHQCLRRSEEQLALRLIDLIITLLEAASEELLRSVQASDCVGTALEHIQGQSKPLKQGCYSLLSSVVKYVGVAAPAQLLGVVFKSCERKSESLSNNCLFCMLQIMQRYQIGEEYVADMYGIAMSFLETTQPQRKIFQITYSKIIGKLSFIHPTHLAAMLPQIARRCFSAIKSDARDTVMLEAYTQALQPLSGFFKLVLLNPSAALASFDALVDSYLFFKAPSAETDATFAQLLREYRAAAGEAGWQSFLGRKLFLPAAVQRINGYLA